MGSTFPSRWVTSALALLATSCSVVSSRPPPSVPDDRTPRAAARCGGIWYPIADTLSVIAGATWVAHADSLEEASRSKTYTVAPDGSTTLTSETPPSQNYDVERYLGYGVMGVFGASALYGYIIEAQCASFRHKDGSNAQKEIAPVAPARRVEPPTAVLGFSYDMTPAAAEQTCTARQQSWQLKGSIGSCAPGARADAKLVRVEFQSGALHKIAVIHVAAAPDQLPTLYEQLLSALRGTYGEPQLARANYSEACSKSLADCLKNGEKPRGPLWHFATGTIELQPVWQDDHATLEERYAHEEQLAP